MRRALPRVHQQKRRSALFLFATFFPIGAFFLAAWLLSRLPARLTILLVGEPMVIWSFRQGDEAATALALPTETTIDAVYGYGSYSLSALWKLGSIEKLGGDLLRLSVSEAVGLPISWYIGPKIGDIPTFGNPREAVDRYLTSRSLLHFLWRNYETNLSSRAFLTAQKASGSELRSLAIAAVIPPESEGDRETFQLRVDREAIDGVIGHEFEDPDVRAEGLSVAVYNTTSIPGLAERAARTLSHLGAVVVTVGNDPTALERCSATGTKASLTSKTARLIRDTFRCQEVRGEHPERADIVLRVGQGYARTFEPRNP